MRSRCSAIISNSPAYGPTLDVGELIPTTLAPPADPRRNSLHPAHELERIWRAYSRSATTTCTPSGRSLAPRRGHGLSAFLTAAGLSSRAHASATWVLSTPTGVFVHMLSTDRGSRSRSGWFAGTSRIPLPGFEAVRLSAIPGGSAHLRAHLFRSGTLRAGAGRAARSRRVAERPDEVYRAA
jgi:hypothetical protein